MRLCSFVMATTSLGPSLNESQPHLPDLVLFTIVVRFWLPFYNVVLPSNIRVHDHIWIKQRQSYLIYCYWFDLHFGIGLSLFDSYVIVNSYIAWKNNIIKGEPESHHYCKKYQIRQVRLRLIQRWTKRCSRHYKATQPHRQKRLQIVNIPIAIIHFDVHCNAKAKPVKPGSTYHDEPVLITRGQGTCLICNKKTRWHCFGCSKELEGIYPVCSPSVRNCNELHHRARNDIWYCT